MERLLICDFFGCLGRKTANFKAYGGSRKLSHPVRFNDMAMIRVQSRAVRAISLMETFRRYEHRIGPLG